MTFSKFTEFLQELSETTKRNQMMEILSRLLRELSVEEMDKAIYLLQGRLVPFYIPLEFGVSEKLCLKAITYGSGLHEVEVNIKYRERGDLGEVASLLIPQSQSRLMVLEVYERLQQIAQMGGEGSIARKVEILSRLLKDTGGEEAKYIIRMVLGNLRLGVGDPTILDAISFAHQGDKGLRPILERAYNLTSDLGFVAKLFSQEGIAGLRGVRVSVGRPIRMALAERLSSGEEIVKKIGKCSIEPKYDGFRCQVHLKDGQVSIFSRNLENTTKMFPDVAEGIIKQIKAESVIIEGEAVAYNPNTNEYYPFQTTAQRKRKHDVQEMAEKLPLKLFAFDILFLNGQDITQNPYSLRREYLIDSLTTGEVIEPTPAVYTDDPREIDELLNTLVEQGLEGLMAKRLDAPYQAGGRNFNWIKLKRGYQVILSDTIDAVLLGYFKGKGQRTKFGIGALLVGVYDEVEDRFKTIGKIGTGPTEEEWIRFNEILEGLAITHKHARVDSVIEADVWVEPTKVVVVQADEITRSPVHTCGKVNSNPGYALRFPRVVGFIREDKTAEQATTVAEILKMFDLQKRVSSK